MTRTCRPLCLATLALALSACAGTPSRGPSAAATTGTDATMFSAQRSSLHRDGDDLLTAGLGLTGLQAMTPPGFADAARPTAAEARRRALWANWRGIADLSPGGGYGTLYGSLQSVPGREFHALAQLPGAAQPHRVLVQVPDDFDRTRRCLVVTASSGSRGIYGAIAVAGAWGLPKGCAVAYTDKGAGSDYFDLDAGIGIAADGTPTAARALAVYAPDGAGQGIAFKHAHSGDNPEADWGRHVRQAAEFALQTLGEVYPDDAPFEFGNTRVIAVGISNGGGAVLRAAELEGEWLDAVVAGEPSVNVDAPGARTLYDYTTEAALLMPCAQLALENLPQPPLTAQVAPLWGARCASLRAAGLIEGGDTVAQSRDALQQLRASGWTEGALRAGALSTGFDLWRAIAATYASAYGRYGADAHPCGYRYAAQGADGVPRPATAVERAMWWSDGSGIPPGSGVGLVDTRMAGGDPLLPGLQCLRGLATGAQADAHRVQAGIAQTRVGLPRAGLPVVLIHGVDDGLIPMAFTSTPYVAQAQAAGRDVRFWQVAHAQHFDGFLALPDYGARYVPLLPYLYTALDRVDAHLDGKGVLPADAAIATTPRGAAAKLDASHLAVPPN